MAELPANSAGVEVDRSFSMRVRVMLPLPLPEALDYLPPDGAMPPEPGSFVRVGLGSRRLVGVVWDAREESGDEVPVERLKPVIEVLPTPPLRPEARRFVERVAAYTLAPPGMVLRMSMSVEEALWPRAPRRVCASHPGPVSPVLAGSRNATSSRGAAAVLHKPFDDDGTCSSAGWRAGRDAAPGVVREPDRGRVMREEWVSSDQPAASIPD
jgi:primosomal protein N' (replication factor Y)